MVPRQLTKDNYYVVIWLLGKLTGAKIGHVPCKGAGDVRDILVRARARGRP
jgi:hypothetical protein